MAKKKVHTGSIVRNSGKNDPIEVKIDFNDLKEGDLEDLINDEPSIRKLIMKPSGYPIRINNTPNLDNLKIENKDLFQAYASDQWSGLNVSVNEYLFDQMTIPDFAFQIVKILPKNAHRIALDTEFEVILETPELKIKDEKVSFSEIVGNAEAIEKCKIVLEAIKNPEKFGYWAPKNILFYGPPGTGKTLTAKALASESDVKIIAHKGTSLIGLHVGDGANRIHSLFEKASELSPCIIFIDELDSIGLSRNYQSVRGDVIEVTTALLAEMDGIDINKGVITIGATNSIDLLDPGLRSRFEEEIEFPLPDLQNRIDIIKLYLSKIDKKINLNIDYNRIARETEGFSGRDIKEKLIKKAVHKTIINKTTKITTKDLSNIIKSVVRDKKTSSFYS
jgi:AAA family ATPase